MIICEHKHLEHAEDAARKIKQNIADTPAFSALSTIIHECLRDVFDESGSQLDVRKVVEIIKPCDGSNTCRNYGHNHKESHKTDKHSSNR